MKVISHRGNLEGPNYREENTVSAVERAIRLGLEVEVDVWLMSDGEWRLGHDNGSVAVSLSWLIEVRDYLWIHCKNIGALRYLSCKSEGLHFFWHENDQFTLTSKNFVWAFPSKVVIPNFINVLPERNNLDIEEVKSIAGGVCTDFPYWFTK